MTFKYALTINEKHYYRIKLSTPLHIGDEVCLPNERVKVTLIRHIIMLQSNTDTDGLLNETVYPTVLVELINNK